MKYIFACIAVFLVLSSVGMYASMPDVSSDVPVIYWVTDRNPARVEQVRLFHQWLVENGHVTERGKPAVELRLDVGNRDTRKQIIQGVSGVAGDVMDLGSLQVPYFRQLGIIKDVSQEAARLNFGPDQTYKSILPEITAEGGQYGFPCNVSAIMLWVNKSAFKRFDVELPPTRWTLEDFERIGKAFVQAANPPGQDRDYFFTPNMALDFVYRTKGLSRFNEALTASSLDDPRFVESMQLIRKWTYEDRILPTRADLEGQATEAGYGGAKTQLFAKGYFGLLMSGRYMLIGFRQFGAMELDVVEFPHGGYPCTRIQARCATVYTAGDTENAALFMSYLASEKYNMQIVRDADALPPNPRFADTEAFRRPPNYPNEWGLHEKFLQAAQGNAYPSVHSPFVLTADAIRHERDAYNGFMIESQRLTAQEAAAQAARRINKQIQQNVTGDPALAQRYLKAQRRQHAIDAKFEAGQPVPEHWISNPFLLGYHRDHGKTVVNPDADPAAYLESIGQSSSTEPDQDSP